MVLGEKALYSLTVNHTLIPNSNINRENVRFDSSDSLFPFCFTDMYPDIQQTDQSEEFSQNVETMATSAPLRTTVDKNVNTELLIYIL